MFCYQYKDPTIRILNLKDWHSLVFKALLCVCYMYYSLSVISLWSDSITTLKWASMKICLINKKTELEVDSRWKHVLVIYICWGTSANWNIYIGFGFPLNHTKTQINSFSMFVKVVFSSVTSGEVLCNNTAVHTMTGTIWSSSTGIQGTKPLALRMWTICYHSPTCFCLFGVIYIFTLLLELQLLYW